MAEETARDLRRQRRPFNFRRSAMRHGHNRKDVVLPAFRRIARLACVWKKSANLWRNGGSAVGWSEGQSVLFGKSFGFDFGRKTDRNGSLDVLHVPHLR